MVIFRTYRTVIFVFLVFAITVGRYKHCPASQPHVFLPLEYIGKFVDEVEEATGVAAQHGRSRITVSFTHREVTVLTKIFFVYGLCTSFHVIARAEGFPAIETMHGLVSKAAPELEAHCRTAGDNSGIESIPAFVRDLATIRAPQPFTFVQKWVHKDVNSALIYQEKDTATASEAENTAGLRAANVSITFISHVQRRNAEKLFRIMDSHRRPSGPL